MIAKDLQVGDLLILSGEMWGYSPYKRWVHSVKVSEIELSNERGVLMAQGIGADDSGTLPQSVNEIHRNGVQIHPEVKK
jgi:hypothetical protein